MSDYDTGMNSNQVNEFNAYRFSDNYTVQTEAEPHNVIGCEHNRQEADALAKYLTSSKGVRHVVIANGKDVVRAAKRFRPTPLRYEFREEAFRAMGV